MRIRIILLLLLVSGSSLVQNLYGQFKVIGYLPTWNGYPNSINNVDLTKVTHINIAFANPNTTGDLSTAGGTLANLATVVTTAHAANVKVLMSIGGAGAPGTTYTNLITADLSGFVAKIVQYTVDNNLDGIDVDIEGDVLNGTTMNSTQYQDFITALETGLHAQNKLMTAALATWFASRVTNLAASKFDFINLMSYDAYGTWTGPGQHSPYTFAVSDLNYWSTTKGIPVSKLTVGVPFYGYYWGNSNTSMRFANIVSSYSGSENTDQVNPPAGGVIYYNGIPTIKQKTVLALSQAGGIMIWELTQDATGTKSLLSAIDEVIDGYATNVAPTVTINAPTAGATYTEGDTISIDITANDPDGSIMKTEYYAGTVKIGEQYGTPSVFKWSTAGPGTYSLTVMTTDNIGASATSASVSVTVNVPGSSLPFKGTAFSIPGKIEVENFNLGGNGIAYSDASVANEGGAYRTGRVDIEVCSDNGGGYDVGWTSAGEWLEYTVDVTSAGQYDFQARVATQNAGKNFYIQIDGVNVTGTIAVPNTTGWQKWQTITASNITLTQGIKKMRIVFGTGDFNINYINTLVSTPTSLLPSDLYKNSTTIYPNPVVQSSLLHFNLKQSGPTKVSLFDEQGIEKILLADQFMNAGEHELTLEKKNLPKGIYFCRILNEGELISMKVLIE
jgi:chitinase